MSETSSSQPGSARVEVIGLTEAQIDLSCQVPLLLLFGAGAFWLVFSSVFAFIASLKFHNPNFLADYAWLTYGRVRPVANDAFLYGFAVPAGIGVGLWILARIGRTAMAQPLLVTVGVGLWNIGMLLGVSGILAGDSTGYEMFEMPRYAALFLFLGYMIVAVFGLITFYGRQQRTVFVSQWFIVAAIFWFPWIFITASMLLLVSPVRGVTQAVISWWYTGNVIWLWLSLIGLGVLFYMIPRFTRREISGYYLAAVTFWVLLLAASWIGVPNSAPVPAWLPAASTVGTVFMGFAILTLILNLYQSLDGQWSLLKENVILRFAGFGLLAFVVTAALSIVGSISQVADFTDLTWYTQGRTVLQTHGFFSMLLFGAIYHIVPQLLDLEMIEGTVPVSVAKLARLNLWLTGLGVAFLALAFVIGGIIQGVQLNNSKIAFASIITTNTMVARVATIGDVLILGGNLLFAISLGRLVIQFWKARAAAAYAEATAIIPTAGVKV